MDDSVILGQHWRKPDACPPGFQGRYTVVPGDTMFLIAERFGVSLDALIAANPHIPDSNLLPGDVLCVPGVPIPCCLILSPQPPAPTNAAGVALFRWRVPALRPFALSVLAHDLPEPSTLGDFIGYVGFLQWPGINFIVPLHRTPEEPPTWAGTLADVISVLPPPEAVVEVRLQAREPGVLGPAVLAGTMAQCGRSR